MLQRVSNDSMNIVQNCGILHVSVFYHKKVIIYGNIFFCRLSKFEIKNNFKLLYLVVHKITHIISTDDMNKIDGRKNLYSRIKRWDINVTLRNQFCQEDPI